jgi:glycosyltransferase involved in cell wall biosynthesis
MKINLLAPINSLGYGVTGLNVLKSLSDLHSQDVSLNVIGSPSVNNNNDAELVRKCLDKGRFFSYDAPCIKIWHQHDMAQFVGRGKRIGFPIFELDKFNDVEKHQLESLDMIFVCSEWAKKVILENIKISEENVKVIPLGVDSSIFKESSMPVDTPTRFLNCGKWEIRKGHDVLVELFNLAFNEDDNVELFMMCSNPFLKDNETMEWIDLYKNSKLGSKIHIIPYQRTQEEVYNIMSQVHCGIFPSRAEGWNLEVLEMMACGKHIITTDYSAHTEFCNIYNCQLIPISETETAYDGKWFHGQGNWAKFDNQAKIAAIQHMRDIHLLNTQGRLKVNSAGLDTAKQFSWHNTGRKILDVI